VSTNAESGRIELRDDGPYLLGGKVEDGMTVEVLRNGRRWSRETISVIKNPDGTWSCTVHAAQFHADLEKWGEDPPSALDALVSELRWPL